LGKNPSQEPGLHLQPGETPSDYYDDEDEVKRALELCRQVVELSEKKIEI
jgi:hypothetical protein